MRRLTLILLFVSSQTLAQDQLNYGKVLTDKDFTCNTRPFLDSFFNLANICDAKNELEIRLRISYMPLPDFDFIVVTYDGNKWAATKYEENWGDPSTSGAQIKSYKLQPSRDFETIFSALKRNNIFTLPNQSDINIKRNILDGVVYTLTFKAGDKFRTYYFDNPTEYRKQNKKMQEFKNYERIATILYSWFDKE